MWIGPLKHTLAHLDQTVYDRGCAERWGCWERMLAAMVDDVVLRTVVRARCTTASWWSWTTHNEAFAADRLVVRA